MFKKRIIPLLCIVTLLNGCTSNPSEIVVDSEPSKVMEFINNRSSEMSTEMLDLLGEGWTLEDDAKSNTSSYVRVGYLGDNDMLEDLRVYATSTAIKGTRDTFSYVVRYEDTKNISNSLWYDEAVEYFLDESSKLFGVDLRSLKSNKDLFYSIISVSQVQKKTSAYTTVEVPDGEVIITTYYDKNGYEFECEYRIVKE